MTCFGFRTGSFAGWSVEQAAAELVRLGYDCLELCLEPPDVRPELMTEKRCCELRRTLDALKTGLASVSYHGDREPLAERLANQGRAIQAAHWLGADIVIINAEKCVERDRQWAEHVTQLRRLCEQAEAANVTIAVEPEPLLVIGSSAEMLEMLRAVGSPRLKVNLDVGHAQVTDDDLAASVRQLGADIVHLHLEDIKGRVHRHLLFGEGDVDWGALRQALIKIGYAGPYVADLFNLGNDPSGVAAQALAGLRRLFA